MLTPEILKILGMVLGPAILLLMVYLKGRGDGKRVVNEDVRESEENLNRDIKQAEAKNADAERKTDVLKDDIRDAAPSELLRLWTKIGWGPQDPGDNPPKQK